MVEGRRRWRYGHGSLVCSDCLLTAKGRIVVLCTSATGTARLLLRGQVVVWQRRLRALCQSFCMALATGGRIGVPRGVECTMVFSSHIFLFYFLPLALLLYYAMPQRGRNLLLTLLSYVFYGWVNPLFVVLMLASTTFDYVCGLCISNQFRRRAWEAPVPLLTPGGGRTRAQRIALLVTLTSNLSLLGFFKYCNFATESWTGLMATLGLP